jgi:hypothetical protein
MPFLERINKWFAKLEIMNYFVPANSGIISYLYSPLSLGYVLFWKARYRYENGHFLQALVRQGK